MLERARAAGIERILVPGWDVASSEAALALAHAYPGFIDAAVGVHPHHAASIDEAGWASLERLADDRATRAIGEIGLDHFRNLSPPETQREVLERQLAMAAEWDLPVLVHDRDAHAETEEALLGWGGRSGHPARGVLHAFSGDAAMAARLTEAGFLVSFALPVAFTSARGPREAARLLPDGRFLVETDAPYLGPERDVRNEPTTSLRVVTELARLRGSEPDGLVGGIRAAYEALIG